MSFEETYKTSYSHGLESIYALETVDPRSIRRLSNSQEKPPPIPTSSHIPRLEPPQLELDFGPDFRNWIKPFLLDEPIQVLGLSRHAEKPLLEQNKLLLGDLIGCDLTKMIFYRGMGQGHVDEIEQKLASYIRGRELKREQQIDLASWIRTLCPAAGRKQYAALLGTFGLEELLPLTTTENLEMRRLTQEQKQEWADEGMRLMQKKETLIQVQKAMYAVTAAFVKPWVLGRKGLAAHHEIVERIQKKSISLHLVEPVFEFFASAFYNNCFPLDMIEIDREVYAATPWHAEAFHNIVRCAKSYLRFDKSCFSLTHLVSLIEREQAKAWRGFPEGFTEKVLRLSPFFHVRKGDKGFLEITKKS